MSYAKQEIQTKILEILKSENKAINPSFITQKLGWNKDAINEVCNLYVVAKFIDILKQIPDIQIQKNENGTAYVSLSNKKETNATEEKMANNQNEAQKNEKLHDRMEKLLEFLNTNMLEREEAIRLALLAAVANESVFFLGAPGTGKSMIANRIKEAFKADGNDGVKYFEYLMNQYSTPDTIFGPTSLPDLEKGVIKTLTDGYLPKADVAFLDEIWKANSIILNTLLWIINEKKYKNGNIDETVPLKLLVTASNELPPKDEGLEAVWDRMLVRLPVDAISDEAKFMEMISQGSNSSELVADEATKKLLITADELKNWQTDIDDVELSEAAGKVIIAICKALEQKNAETNRDDSEKYYVSGRRWKKIVHLLRTSAFLNDRSEVDLMDCQLIEYCIWGTEKQQEEARLIVRDCIQQNGVSYDTEIEDIDSEITDFDNYIKKNFYKTVTTTDATTGKTASKLAKDESIFGKPAVLKSMQDTADNEEYTPIKEHIEQQLSDLAEFREEMTAPFSANLFADHTCGQSIMSIIDAAQKALEDAQVKLDKTREQYQS